MKGECGIQTRRCPGKSTKKVTQLVVRWLTLSTAVLLRPLDGRITLEGKIRDGDIRRRNVSVEKHLKVPVELHFERQEHVNH